MPGTVLEALTYTVTIPSLQVRKLRHRTAKPFNQTCTAYASRVEEHVPGQRDHGVDEHRHSLILSLTHSHFQPLSVY